MKSHARVCVIGGGVVGASVLYHLTKLGWSDVVLIERSELTSGSTWHAAGGFHTLNGDTNMAALQGYTIGLYKELEALTGLSCGLHHVGGVTLADTPERMDMLKAERAKHRYMGLHTEIIDPDEIKKIAPATNVAGVLGGLYDPLDGHLDPSGTTHAYAKAARMQGAEIILHTQVTETRQTPEGQWQVVTDQGTMIAEHLVNAAGLWAREVAAMAGVYLPLHPMEHQYIVTDDIPMIFEAASEHPHVMDPGGESYLRQEGRGLCIGFYEQACKAWAVDGTPWDFGHELLPDNLDKITASVEFAYKRFPVLQTAGVKSVIHGPFTFAPDGNPLIGPIRGLKNYWCACGVMAGFSQGGGVGLALANWITEGDPGFDVWGMDVSRYGDWTTMAYTNAKVRENYSRRFQVRFPNEELPAARPLRTTPIYEKQKGLNAVFGVSFGMEQALWYAPADMTPVENVTFLRSNAFEPIKNECHNVRTNVGLVDISSFAKYEITGPGAESWLDMLLANRLPKAGRLCLTPMLNHNGKLIGDFTVGKLADERFFIFGSGAAEQYHMRWFEENLPNDGSVSLQSHGMNLLGLSIAGPRSRELLSRLINEDASDSTLRFLDFQSLDLGMIPTLTGRISFTGDLGYEFWVRSEFHGQLWDDIMTKGADLGIQPFGSRAMRSLSLEKSFGSWATEYRPIYGPYAARLDRFVNLEKGAFIGRESAAEEKANGSEKTLVTFSVSAEQCDVMGNEPIYKDNKIIGYVTSGGYAHYADRSVALGYVPTHYATEFSPDGFEIEIMGDRCPASINADVLFDPDASHMRS